MEPLVYILNRRKIVPFIIGSGLFVAACSFFLSLGPQELEPWRSRYGSPVEIVAFSFLGVLLFGSVMVSATLKLFGRPEGVILVYLVRNTVTFSESTWVQIQGAFAQHWPANVSACNTEDGPKSIRPSGACVNPGYGVAMLANIQILAVHRV